MPIFAKYLVVFENRNRDSQVVRVFYKREATTGEITPTPNTRHQANGGCANTSRRI